MKQPTLRTLERWMDKGGCKALDGCWVEIDGWKLMVYARMDIQVGLLN